MGGCLGWSAIVYMSSGMFRGKESSNRIELSRLVQDLLNFGLSGSLWLWGYGGEWMGVGVVEWCPPHMCTCMHTHTHMCVVNMIISCKWPPPWGNPWEFPMMSSSHVHACICTCVGAPSHHPHSHPPTPPPRGAPWNQSKFNST